MQRIYFSIGHSTVGLGELFKRVLILLSGEKQIRVHTDNMDVCFAVFELHEWIAAATGNIDRAQQLVHQLIRGQLETLLEFFSVVGQPTLYVKNIECFIG